MDIHQAAEQRKVDIEEIVQEMKKKIADYTEKMERTKKSVRKSRERIASARNKVLTSVEELMRLLQEHEKFMITRLDVSDSKVQREQAAQLQHFEICRNQLQTQVEWCEGILQKNDSVKILQAQDDLIWPPRSLQEAEKLSIYKPSHLRYEINKEHMETMRSVVSAVGRVVESNTDPLQCVAMELRKGEVGIGRIIKVNTKDSEGNPFHDENDQVYMKVQPPSGKETSYRMTAPGKNGEYSLTYTPESIGEHKVNIAFNGEPLTGSPWRVPVTAHKYKPLFSFGSYGKRPGEFKYPCSIAIDIKSEKVAVADRKRVQLFSLEGTYLTEISNKKPIESSSVAFTKTGELIVIASNKISCFDESCKFVRHISSKHLRQPGCLTIAGDGSLMVCDWGDNTVKVLSPDGCQLLLTISDPSRGTPLCPLHHQNMFFVCFGSSSSFSSVKTVKVFSEDGVFLELICLGFFSGQIAIDRFDNLAVCGKEKKLQIIALDGKFVSEVEEDYIKNIGPCSVAASRSGQLFVTDEYQHCVHVFQ